MNESDIINKIKNKWLGHIVRIESSTTSGIPDLFICFAGICVWLEVKVLRGDYIYLEKFQPQFHVSNHISKGNCFILAADKQSIKIMKIQSAFSVKYALEINKFKRFDVTDGAQIEVVHSFTPPFNWTEIFFEFMRGLGHEPTGPTRK